MLKLALVLSLALVASAQTTDEQFKTLNGKLDQILKILAEAEQAAPTPTTAKVTIGDSPILGDDKAPITIVEFTDMQCPFCQRFHLETFPKLRDQYISTGKVRFVSRDLPQAFHNNAQGAAEAGLCAGEQGQFWQMRDWMQTNPNNLSLDELAAHGASLGLDLKQYRLCMANAKYREAVKTEAQQARDLHIDGTPTFVIGNSGPVVDGEIIEGARPYEMFTEKLDVLLTKSKGDK